MKTKYFLTGLLGLILMGSWLIYSPLLYKAVPENSNMTIAGTSNLHDWEMKLNKLKCDVSVAGDNTSLVFQKATFVADVNNIEGESSIMDKKAHDALKTDKYPQVKFQLTNEEPVSLQNGVFKGTAKGDLTLAGVTKKIEVPFTGKYTSKDIINLSGSKKIDMTAFNIEPPTALMGSLKTGKEVTISFSFNFKQQ